MTKQLRPGRHANVADTPSNRVRGVTITHSDRELYRDPPLTKLDLARYYEAAGDVIMPHLKARRVALLRCPDGTDGQCFFQKHLGEHVPKGVRIDEGMVVIRDIDGLIALVQRGVIEFHTWGATSPHAVRPDRLTFDLDPDPGLSWRSLANATQRVKHMLLDLGLHPFLKTTGGKGLHVVVPLRGAADWNDVREFCKALARQLEDAQPDVFVANMSKAQRQGHIFVDYLRNSEGATAVAALSARARDGAPVSMPVAWQTLDSDKDPRADAYNVCNALQEVERWTRADPWENYEEARSTLTAAIRRRIGIG